jgi:hypothetical protein
VNLKCTIACSSRPFLLQVCFPHLHQASCCGMVFVTTKLDSRVVPGLVFLPPVVQVSWLHLCFWHAFCTWLSGHWALGYILPGV